MTAEAAAALLGTSTTTLSLWEERFGYPVSKRSPEGQPVYADEAMIALRDALSRELSIASAITEARRDQSRRRRSRRLTGARGRFAKRRRTPQETQ